MWHKVFVSIYMNTLFPLEPVWPPGFSYFENFISKEEEDRLLGYIQGIELHSFQFQGYEGKRRTASFGFDYSFEKGTLSKGENIPPVFNFLIEKVADKISLAKESFVELLVTEYPEGSVINWHRDAPPFGLIVGISLLSDCNLRLRPYEKTAQKKSSIISLPVKRRSLYIMDGPSRTDWQHSIAPVKDKRYSITLRTLKN